MQKQRGRNNASTLFGVHQIPSDPQIRNLLDPVEPWHLAPLFIDTVHALYRQGHLQTHRMLGGVAIALDGHDKQDCELAASALWLAQWVPRIVDWGGGTFLGDDLYCHQPFCQQVRAQALPLFVYLPAIAGRRGRPAGGLV